MIIGGLPFCLDGQTTFLFRFDVGTFAEYNCRKVCNINKFKKYCKKLSRFLLFFVIYIQGCILSTKLFFVNWIQKQLMDT